MKRRNPYIEEAIDALFICLAVASGATLAIAIPVLFYLAFTTH